MKKYLNGELVELTSEEIAEHNELITTAATALWLIDQLPTTSLPGLRYTAKKPMDI